MLKGVARKHSKQQQHHSPSGCAFLRGQLQVRGAGPLSVAKRKRGPKFGPPRGPDLGPRKLQPAPVLTQRPRTCPGKPTPQRCAHSDRNQTQKSHTLSFAPPRPPPAAAINSPTLEVIASPVAYSGSHCKPGCFFVAPYEGPKILKDSRFKVKRRDK